MEDEYASLRFVHKRLVEVIQNLELSAEGTMDAVVVSKEAIKAFLISLSCRNYSLYSGLEVAVLLVTIVFRGDSLVSCR